MSERRAELLAAAERLFHQYGPRKTTVADIAAAAGVAVGTVYLEFPNKDAIFGALSEARHREILAAVEKAWGRRGNYAARLERAMQARIEAFFRCAASSPHGADLVHCRACGAIERAERAFREAETALFARFIAEGVAGDAFVSRDPAATARALLIAYRSFSPPAMFEVEPAALRSDLAAVHALVVHGLLRR